MTDKKLADMSPDREGVREALVDALFYGHAVHLAKVLGVQEHQPGEPPRALAKRTADALLALRTAQPSAGAGEADWEGFVREMFDDRERGDWDGGEIQDVAEKHGVLIRTTVTEPCDPEHCVCAEYGEFPLECFRLAPRTHPATPVAVSEAQRTAPATEAKHDLYCDSQFGKRCDCPAALAASRTEGR